ncbi:MAG: thiamine phosphate synthase [Sphingomonadales bacterium]|nr:thiamine phosphate synthase [Sphingomonadales bacterium]
MARCYSVPVPERYPSLTRLWLLTDARNDAALEAALARLPRGSGLVLRHYHLPEAQRRARFRVLARVARRFGHCVVLSGSAAQARRWGADGAYGAAARLTRGPVLLRLVTAHSLRELGEARRARADAVLLSPVWPSASHPGGKALGTLRFRLLSQRAGLPVIALGGMNLPRARALKPAAWAAIDGLST